MLEATTLIVQRALACRRSSSLYDGRRVCRFPSHTPQSVPVHDQLLVIHDGSRCVRHKLLVETWHLPQSEDKYYISSIALLILQSLLSQSKEPLNISIEGITTCVWGIPTCNGLYWKDGYEGRFGGRTIGVRNIIEEKLDFAFDLRHNRPAIIPSRRFSR